MSGDSVSKKIAEMTAEEKGQLRGKFYRERLPKKFREMTVEGRKHLVEKIGQTAADDEIKYSLCSQCTLAALMEHLDLWDINTLKATTTMAGGVAHSGEMCGALLAGVMAIGMVYGRDDLSDSPPFSIAYQECLERSERFVDEFKKEFGSLSCRDVQKGIFGRSWNFKDPEQLVQFITTKELHDKCGDVVCRKAARFAAEAILEPV